MMEIGTILLWVIYAAIIYMIYFMLLWILLDLLGRTMLLVDQETTPWPAASFVYVDAMWLWTPFHGDIWDTMGPLFGPGLDPWVLLLVWALPDRIIVLKPDVMQNWTSIGNIG